MAHWNLSLFFGFQILWAIFNLCSAFPTGAPASACENMLPVHTGVQPQQTVAPYEFLVSSPSFLNGQPINSVYFWFCSRLENVSLSASLSLGTEITSLLVLASKSPPPWLLRARILTVPILKKWYDPFYHLEFLLPQSPLYVNPATGRFSRPCDPCLDPINISFQILGPAYRGLLLEARSFGSTAALGSWKTPPNNTKLLQCSGNPHGAVTHSNTNFKTRQTTYTWLPPNSGCPPVVTFLATVAQSHEIYWTNIKSKVIWKNPKATCGAETLTRTLSAAAPLLLVLFEYI